MTILCRNDIFSLKIKPVFHMILIYVSLNELFYRRSCFNLDADISISNRYLESATNLMQLSAFQIQISAIKGIFDLF